MSWLAAAHLIDRFGQDAVASLQAGGADVSTALRDAMGECESWLSRAVTLPIVEPGSALLRIACDIARYNLWRRHLAEDHPAYLAYRRAVADLTDAGAGKMTLAGLVGSPPPGGDSQPAAGGWAVMASPRVFTDALLGHAGAVQP